jgi:hypothetical protein
MRNVAMWASRAIPLVMMLAICGCGGGGGTSGASTGASPETAAGGPGVSSGSSTNSSHGSGGSQAQGGSQTSGKSRGASRTASHGSSVSTTASRAGLPSGQTLVTVEGRPITKATYEHWLAVTTALNGSSKHGTSTAGTATEDQTLGFLISTQWLFDEAGARRISVSETAVSKHLAEAQQKVYHTPAELQKYLAKAKETMADLLLRAKAELLESAISQQVLSAKHTTAEKQAALSSFKTAFQAKWKAQTSCQPGYVVEDCKQYKSA